ncbi:hypothetical protein R0131_10730 [Clostridium sp. AL.422]|uniref:hypothetical protein n=1 Tax=Clostridium TaxID=1485 RepID=UPI00293DD844|nr:MULTISPECIES: hypothetical protein [unclassified Clostridium]MDV4151317.1 hypothetical protein [Clostridium sp. AL.422]
MDKIIPILPCQSIREQAEFFKNLGFITTGIYTAPNPYASLEYGTIEIHFYGTKKIKPSENPNTCFVLVEDVDNIYETFITNYKKNTGKIPRSGIPRISKLRDLASDRRFTLTDVGGNTFYIGTPIKENFFRIIDSKEYAKNYKILYDLIYSKEDYDVAFNMLTKFFPIDITSIKASDMDLIKILLVALDINLQKNKVIDEKINGKIMDIISNCDKENSKWKRILERYYEIINL